jgi:hypothetical protein
MENIKVTHASELKIAEPVTLNLPSLIRHNEQSLLEENDSTVEKKMQKNV